MATWEELSRDCLRAAKLLAAEGHFRSSVSRAYYSAYCAITSGLVAGRVSFPFGRNNPSHEQLPDLVRHNLAWPQATRRRVSQKLRILRRSREDADYRPGVAVDQSLSLHCVLDASAVLRELGIDDE